MSLTLLHSERPKLDRVLAVMSAKGLKMPQSGSEERLQLGIYGLGLDKY